jgi:hypothetical protein
MCRVLEAGDWKLETWKELGHPARLAKGGCKLLKTKERSVRFRAKRGIRDGKLLKIRTLRFDVG